MERNKRLQLQQARVFLFFIAICEASANFISGDGLSSHGTTGRHLLQGRSSCPVNFEFANYTIVTSQCKGPRYRPDVCCKAFKEFACPYRDYLNDASNACSTFMYSYLNPIGSYPTSLFASICREGKEGLNCTGVALHSDQHQSSCAPRFYVLSSSVVGLGFISTLFMLF